MEVCATAPDKPPAKRHPVVSISA
uniref:Uncharacterized protein n=1 Tax=Rhizophora mucronata TaxID=61149 RepID=A0A2P2QDD9_RHIMU